jgi:hypothetical protein
LGLLNANSATPVGDSVIWNVSSKGIELAMLKKKGIKKE